MEAEHKLAKETIVAKRNFLSKKVALVGVVAILLISSLSIVLILLKNPVDVRSKADVGQAIILTAEPSSFNAVKGKTQIVDISVDTQGIDVIGIDVTLSYNISLLNFPSFSSSQTLGKVISQSTQITPGIYRISYVVVEKDKALKGKVSLGKLQFVAKTSGLSDLGLVASQAVGKNGAVSVQTAMRAQPGVQKKSIKVNPVLPVYKRSRP